MTLRPASWPWLLRHELRLARRQTSRTRGIVLLVLGGVLWLALHAGAWALLRIVGAGEALPPSMIPIGGAVLWIVFTLMLSQAIAMSVSVFFDRGDLDLLLSSPLPPRNVFIVRGLGVAVGSVAIWALLLTPFAHAGLVTGHAALLSIYPALASLALLAAALGMALTTTLVRLLGARRARTAAQLLGALVGAAMFLTSQLGNLVARDHPGSWLTSFVHSMQGDGPLGPSSLLWLPFDAILGQPAALATLVVVGGGAFVLVVGTMARRFFDGTQESATVPAPMAGTATIDPARFRGPPWRVVLVKEWKLIGRDPQLIASTLLQSLYMLPMVFVWARRASPDTVILPGIVLTATTLAAGLAWLTVTAEDAPELLASAPVPRALMHRAKLAAAVLPVWLVLSPVALYLLATRPVTAVIFAACVAGATLAVGIIQLALPQRGSRRDLRRRAKGNTASTFTELVTTAGWAALAWCLLAAPRFAPIAVVPAIGAPFLAWLFGRGRRRVFADA